MIERQDEIEVLKKTVVALKLEHEDLSLKNVWLEKKIGALSEEIVLKGRTLDKLQTKLVMNYRSVFIENMSAFSGTGILFRYVAGNKDFKIESIDDISAYKQSINPPFFIIEQSLDDYKHNYLEAYSLVPDAEKKKFVKEFREKLRKRQDLKTPSFDEKAFQDVIYDMQRKINSIPTNVAGMERSQQEIIIRHECTQKIIQLKSRFQRMDLDRIFEFWER